VYTLDLLRQDLTARVSLTANATQVQNWQDSAIKEMVDSTWWRITDVCYADLPINGTNQRWYLTGDNIAILPPEYQYAPDGSASPPYYVPFTSVLWRQRAPDDVIVEETLNFSNEPPPAAPLLQNVSPNALADWTGIGAIVATSPPGIPQGATASNAFVRVWYQRRIPEPYYPDGSNFIRVPPNFARIATLGFYLGILSDNQAGGDLRLWRKRADEYLAQAQLIYNTTVPIVKQQHQKPDEWLITGVPS